MSFLNDLIFIVLRSEIKLKFIFGLFFIIYINVFKNKQFMKELR